MKLTIETDDRIEMRRIAQASSAFDTLIEFSEWLRQEIKYDHAEHYEPVRERFFALMADNGIHNLDEYR